MKSIINWLTKLRNNQLVKNILVVGGFTILLKFVSFYKETLVASTFGLSLALDTYLIAMLVPGFINTVFLGSFKNAFIPNYIAEAKTGNAIAPFQSMVFIITGSASILFILISLLVTDTFLENLFPDHTNEYYSSVRIQLYYVLPCLLLWGYSALLSGLLNINGEFRAATGASIFLPVSLIICLMFFKDTFGDLVLAIGTLIGSLCTFTYLLLNCILRNIIRLAIPDFQNNNAIIMLKQVPAKVTSSILSGAHSLIESYFAAQLIVGSVAAMDYGKKLTVFSVGLLTIAISTVLLPYFSKQVIKNRIKSFKTLFKLLKIAFGVSLLVAVIGSVFSETIISVIFERNSFTREDTKVVSAIQTIFFIYLPFKVGGVLLVNFLTSINKNNYQAIVSFVGLAINLVLIYLFLEPFGIYGIALASTLAIILRNILLFTFVLKQRRLE